MPTDELVKITREDGYEKRWILVGREGAVDFHVSHERPEIAHLGLGPIGGIEEHHRTPPDYMQADKPSHDHCWILNGKCWHDGSSLYASEVLIPRCLGQSDADVFDVLRGEYIQRFRSEQPEAVDAVARAATNQHEPSTREKDLDAPTEGS